MSYKAKTGFRIIVPAPSRFSDESGVSVEFNVGDVIPSDLEKLCLDNKMPVESDKKEKLTSVPSVIPVTSANKE